MRVCVCVRLCARVGDSVRMRACVVVMVMVCVYAHQHRTYTLGGGDTLVTTKKKEKEMHTPAAPVCTHLVVCAYVLDICGGGVSYSGLWGHWVLCVCVFVNVNGHLFTG